METISVPCDFFGDSTSTAATLVEFSAANDFLQKDAYSDYDNTGMGWDIAPSEFKDLIRRLRGRVYGFTIYITENGAAFDDELVDGRVATRTGLNYVAQHLQAVSDLNEEGMNIQGYYLWSLLDNSSGASAMISAFGILYVDFETQERIWKDSAHWYAGVIEQHKATIPQEA